MAKPKYKKNDVLQTLMGKIFFIAGFREELDLEGIGIKKYYLLKNHPHSSLPVDYINSSKHIFPATRTAQILYAKAKKV